MTVTTGGRALSVACASSGACSPSPTTYSSSRTAWNPNADAINSIISKSSRWLIVTICPSSLKAKATISLAGTLRMLASSETVMNSVTRTRVFSRSFSSRRFSSWISRKLGPSSRRCTPLRAAGPLIEASVRGREGRRLAPRLLGGGQVLEERGRALFERRLLLVVDRLGRLEHFARLELALRLDGRFGLRLRLGRGHLGRRAAPPLGARLRRRRDRLGGSLHDPPPLGRCGRVLQLAFLALPPRAHQRHLLGLERRQVTAHKDVQLLEHAEQLLRGDAELRRQIVNPRRRHLRLQRRQPAGQSRVFHSHRLYRRPAEPGAQLSGARSPHNRHPARAREALHLVPGARARIRRQYHAAQSVPLQLGPHPRDPHHHPAGPEPETQQPDEPLRHACCGDVSPAAAGPASASSSPPSSVISLRKAISLSASSGVMSAILSTSSRSKSKLSWSVFLPARSSTSTSSTGRPLSSRSDTLVAASSSAGNGANSGPSPPRSSHSRLEYRSIFQPVSSDASRTFWPFRPMASDSWSSSTIAWIVLVSGSENTRATRAGASDSFAKRSGSGDQRAMAMRLPPSSFTTACTREPLSPTHAPTGSIESSRELTAILVRLPASRAVARISTICCWISGTSSLNSAFTNIGSARDRMRRGPFGVSSIRFNTARIVSPWWKCSRWFCSR